MKVFRVNYYKKYSYRYFSWYFFTKTDDLPLDHRAYRWNDCYADEWL